MGECGALDHLANSRQAFQFWAVVSDWGDKCETASKGIPHIPRT